MVTSGQWGMVTTAQAARVGVSRLVLARLAESGHLRRLTHGVYMDSGAPSMSLDDLRAAWLAAEPGRLAEERLADGREGVVVAGATAALLHHMGDLRPDRHDFVSRRRRQSRRPEVRYRRRALEDRDITIVAGLPVMTIERAIADLVDDIGDLSLTADALRDASRHAALDRGRVTELLAPLAASAGFAAGDGAALLKRLEQAAGIDAASVADRLATDPQVGPLVAAGVLEWLDTSHLARLATEPALEQAIRAVSEQVSRMVAASVQPIRDAAAAAIGKNVTQAWMRASGMDRIAEQISRDLASRLLTPDFMGSVTAAIGRSVRLDADDENSAAGSVGAEPPGGYR